MKTIVLSGAPISTNHVYRHTGRISYMTSRARSLKDSYIIQGKTQWKTKPLEGPLRVDVILCFANNARRDIDNFHKLSLDALSGIAWVDDSQIQQLTVEKCVDKINPRIEILITKLK